MVALSTWLHPLERTAYAEFLLAEDVEMDEEIRKATRTGRPFGSEGFINMLEFRLKLVLKPKSVGRPPKKKRGVSLIFQGETVTSKPHFF
jgi:putative transposase